MKCLFCYTGHLSSMIFLWKAVFWTHFYTNAISQKTQQQTHISSVWLFKCILAFKKEPLRFLWFKTAGFRMGARVNLVPYEISYLLKQLSLFFMHQMLYHFALMKYCNICTFFSPGPSGFLSASLDKSVNRKADLPQKQSSHVLQKHTGRFRALCWFYPYLI